MSDTQTAWQMLWEHAAETAGPFEVAEIAPAVARKLGKSEAEARRLIVFLLSEVQRLPVIAANQREPRTHPETSGAELRYPVGDVLVASDKPPGEIAGRSRRRSGFGHLIGGELQIGEVETRSGIGLEPLGVLGLDPEQGIRDTYCSRGLLEPAGDVSSRP